MEPHTGKKNHLTRPGILLAVAVHALCSGGAARDILLWQGKGIVDPGSFFRGSLAGAVLPACPARIKPGRGIVSLPAPAGLIFLLPFGNAPTVLFQLLWSKPGHSGRESGPVFSSPPVNKTLRGSLWKNTCMTI
jgi:hypothetical protein